MNNSTHSRPRPYRSIIAFGVVGDGGRLLSIDAGRVTGRIDTTNNRNSKKKNTWT